MKSKRIALPQRAKLNILGVISSLKVPYSMFMRAKMAMQS